MVTQQRAVSPEFGKTAAACPQPHQKERGPALAKAGI